MPTSLNLLELFSNDPSGFGPTQTLDMTQPAFANTLAAYKTTHQQALIGFLSDIANSSINKDEFYNRFIFSYLTTILEAGLTPDPRNWTQQVDAIKTFAEKANIHDATKPYKQGARVQNGFGGEWYQAVQDVPAGQSVVNNPTYWREPAIGINNNIGVDNETAIGSISYTVSDLGRTKYITSTSTLTDSRDLPVMTGSNATLVGASIRIMRTGTGFADLTINGNGANIDSGGGVVPSLVLKPGDDALFVWLGSVWALLGSAAKRFINPIFRSGTTTVSQTHTGMIIQSFQADFTANTAAGVVFNLPVSFRSTDYHVVGGDIGNACNVVCGTPITNSTFRGFLRNLDGVYLGTSGAVWHAIGW